jgi:hypothetical protein
MEKYKYKKNNFGEALTSIILHKCQLENNQLFLNPQVLQPLLMSPLTPKGSRVLLRSPV